MPSSYSPLRYPGGKSSLAHFLMRVIHLNKLEGGCYAEPFCGGAGAALSLLYSGIVDKIILNDADPAIYSFWWALLTYPEEFLRLVRDTPLTIDEWKKQKIYFQKCKSQTIELGFATFFLNRCNRSGILSANPIGGINQTGKWLIDARFNRKTLIQKLERIVSKKENISISNLDIFIFLDELNTNIERLFVYLDPPYIVHGPKLYLNSFTIEQHIALADRVKNIKKLQWIMTYDNTEFVNTLYSDCTVIPFAINHQAYKAQKSAELLIHHKNLLVRDTPVHKYILNL